MSRLVYRSPLASEGRFKYAEWLRDLRDSSGVYVVRSARTHETLYVGESHSGQLYDTITRHFQDWRGYTSGTTYSPAHVEVAYRTTPPSAAPGHQGELIRRLDPRDNVYEVDDDEPRYDPSEFQD